MEQPPGIPGDDQQEQEQPRRRGRPGKTPEERAVEEQRRIPLSFEGRVKFRPGDPHALDVEFSEARNLRELIIEEINGITGLLGELVEQDELGATISQEENALKALLWERYQNHKHRDHILAVFISIRRRRLRARLQAAHAALEIVQELLAPDDRILRDLQQALKSKQNPASGASDVEIHNEHIYGDAATLKQQLSQFDERVRMMRSMITAGVGWYEEFYVKKHRTTPEALAYIKRGEPVPPNVPLTEAYLLGPYLKYRWREEGYGPAYTLSLGRIPVRELRAEQQNQDG